MPQKPRRQLGWPRSRRLRRVHALSDRHRRRPQLHKMRRLRLPPQLPPPRAGGPPHHLQHHARHRVPAPPPPPPSSAASRGGGSTQPQFRFPAADLLLLLSLRAAHAPRPLRRDSGSAGEHRSAFRRAQQKAFPNEVQSGAEGEDAQVRGESGVEDSEAGRGFDSRVLQRGWGR